MQMLENNQFDMDDPMNDIHGPIRLPFLKKGIFICFCSLDILQNYYYFRYDTTN